MQTYEARPEDLHRRGFSIPRISGEFLESMAALAQRIALLGALNSLSQLTLKATMPGVPDFYQGTEFWDLSLVDPDNRRPVDFAARAARAGVARQRRIGATLARDWAERPSSSSPGPRIS